MPQWLSDALAQYAIDLARGLAVLTLVGLGFAAAAVWGPELANRFFETLP